VVGEEKRKAVFSRIRRIISEKSFILSLLGVVVLAFAVNLIELVCSAGLPAVYTQVLALSDVSAWQNYAYLLFYIHFADDMLIFSAMATLEMQSSPASCACAGLLAERLWS
jgi:hypothetical protein